MKPSFLITGGAGFAGKAIARRLLKNGESGRVCIYSRDEWKQAQMRQELHNDPRLRWFVGDVRDYDRLAWAMQGVDVVIHGAALKRIEVGRYNPEEMVKTNVLGTMNVVQACRACGVTSAVLLSTDKAYQPVSPYGLTKALAESIFLAANDNSGARSAAFAVTRYGNVAGSTGSVIPVWRKAIADGLIPTVTDPDATRFWMNVEEAVDLVLDAATEQREGLIIPHALRAFRLGDLASAMGFTEVNATGLPDWEKMHESLSEGLSSELAPWMSVREIKDALKEIP